jgi:hypothetical protein
VEEAGNTTSTDTASGGTEAQAKKAKIMLTEQQQAFLTGFSLLCPKSVTRDRKIDLDTSEAAWQGCHLFYKPDFSKTEVIKAHVYA